MCNKENFKIEVVFDKRLVKNINYKNYTGKLATTIKKEEKYKYVQVKNDEEKRIKGQYKVNQREVTNAYITVSKLNNENRNEHY